MKPPIFQVETHNLLQLLLPINDDSYYAEKEVFRVVNFLLYGTFGVPPLNLHSVFQKR